MTAADALSQLLTPANGNATGARGTITALREDGLVNVMVQNVSFIPGVPCITPYEDRKVGDDVQVLQIGNTWVVVGPLGPDSTTTTPLITKQYAYEYNLNTDLVFDTQPSTLFIGQRPDNASSPPVEMAVSYWTGSKNVLTSACVGHSQSPIYLTVARTADSIGQDSRITIQVLPHNSDVIPVGSAIAPLTSFSTLLVNLEVGERRDIQLPADWVAAITASPPTIKGFVFVPGQVREASQPIDTTYAILSGITGGITFGQWQAWQPVWTCVSGTQPAVGTGGAITGRYVQVDKTVHFTAQITLGTSPTLGTTAYRITYPVPPRIGSPDMVCLLRLSGLASGASVLGDATVNDNTTLNLQMPTTTANSALIGLTGAGPGQALQAGSIIRIIGTYEAA